MYEIEKLAKEFAEVIGREKKEEILLFRNFLLLAYQQGRIDSSADEAEKLINS